MNMNGLEIAPVSNGFIIHEKAPLGGNLSRVPRTWIFATITEVQVFISSHFDPAKQLNMAIKARESLDPNGPLTSCSDPYYGGMPAAAAAEIDRYRAGVQLLGQTLNGLNAIKEESIKSKEDISDITERLIKRQGL